MADPSILPSSFAAGTTVKLRRLLAAYPASAGWTLTLYLRGAGTLDAEAVADGDAYVVTLSPTDTAALAPGTYRWTERVALDDDVYTADQGIVEITLDMAAAEAGTAQSHAERTLALIEATIEGRIPSGMESYQIGGRAVTKIPLAELARLRGIYAARVWQQKHPGQLMPSAQVVFRDP